MNKDNKHIRRTMKSVALMSSISSYLIGSTLAGLFGGRWLDQRFETMPLFLISGFLLGIFMGSFSVMQLIRHFLGEDNE